MRRIFITGNPTAGKSHLAKLLVEQIGAIRGDGDAARYELRDDPRYRAAVCCYLDRDETDFYASTNPDERWEILRNQSEAIWPAFRDWVAAETERAAGRPLGLESVNLMPDFVARDFPGELGCCVLSASRDELLARLAAKPRWGGTPELQAREADEFFLEQAPRYRALAEASGWPVFTSAEEALPWCLDRLR